MKIIFIAVLCLGIILPAAGENEFTKGREIEPLPPELKPGDYVWIPEISPTGPVVVIVTDQKYAPGKTASPGFLLSGITGEAPSRRQPLGGFEWQPDKSPEGAVSIIFSLSDSLAYVYRNGVQIGRAAFVLDKEVETCGSHVHSALDAVDSKEARNWLAITSIGGGEAPDVKALAAQTKIPSKFLENVYCRLPIADCRLQHPSPDPVLPVLPTRSRTGPLYGQEIR